MPSMPSRLKLLRSNTTVGDCRFGYGVANGTGEHVADVAVARRSTR